MTKWTIAKELLKLLLAYSLTFGAIIIPVPAMWVGVFRFWGQDLFPWLAALAAVLTMPLFLFGANLSYRLSRWFLDNWGKKRLDL